MPRDYYDILGVDRKADAAAIKKAYRRLAKKYHPDVNKDSGASTSFNEAQEAYDILSDAQKRQAYDQFGHAGAHAGAGFNPGAGGGRRTYTTPGGFSFSGEGLNEGFGLDDVFEQFFGRGGASRAGARPQGFGGSTRSSGRSSRGQDSHHTITVPFDQAVHGGAMNLTLQSPMGPQRLEVKIPKGIGDGAQLRLRGKGVASPAGGAAGDLLLTIRIAPHAYFQRQGLDLTVDVPVSIDEAVFGATVEVPTLQGRAKLKVPPGTGSGGKLRVRGAGVENAKGEKGDLYAVIVVDVPSDLTEAQKVLFESLRGQLPDPRKNVKW